MRHGDDSLTNDVDELRSAYLESPPSKPVPESWKWVLSIVDEARLPHLGLPVRWATTEEKHKKIAFNPRTKETVNMETGEKVGRVSVGFIESTRGRHPMPGTEEPASVRYERYAGPGGLIEAEVKDPSGHSLVPCIAHGDYVRVESLESDHLDAKKEIMRRQRTLVDKLNAEPDFARFVMSQEGMDKFFVKVEPENKYYGTLFFYELYFNDIENLWLICDACNLQKSEKEVTTWLSEQWLYGREFLDYLAKEGFHQEAISRKTRDRKGLAQVAIEWFWKRHANYISVARNLQRDIVQPIQLLNTQVDHVIGSGDLQRAKRGIATLNAKLSLLKATMDVEISFSPVSSGSVSEGTVEEASSVIAGKLPGMVGEAMRQSKAQVARRKRQERGELAAGAATAKPADEEGVDSDVKRKRPGTTWGEK